eukprot:13071460-Ditylum_brightwellii.AAC.1
MEGTLVLSDSDPESDRFTLGAPAPPETIANTIDADIIGLGVLPGKKVCPSCKIFAFTYLCFEAVFRILFGVVLGLFVGVTDGWVVDFKSYNVVNASFLGRSFRGRGPLTVNGKGRVLSMCDGFEIGEVKSFVFCRNCSLVSSDLRVEGVYL